MTKKEIIFTEHGRKRCNNRGITKEMINDTLRYGEYICKQGIRFCIVLTKNIPKHFTPNYIEKLIGMTVLVAGMDNAIITVYKNKKSIKRKSKRKSKRKK